jgi:hypothetical protein
MGYKSSKEFQIELNITIMEKNSFIDTLQTLSFDNWVEYKLVETQKRISEDFLSYNKWSFLPNLSAFGNYNFNYMNDRACRVFATNTINLFAAQSS